MSTTQDRVLSVGRSAMGGWRGKAGKAIAKPVAKRTRFSEEQVLGVIGLGLLVLAVYRLVRPVVRAARDKPSR